MKKNKNSISIQNLIQNKQLDYNALFREIKKREVNRKEVNKTLVDTIFQLRDDNKESLITFERKSNLDLKVLEEIFINKLATKELILNIFDDRNPLSDSGVIIKNGKIKSSGVIYKSRDNKKDKDYFMKNAIYLHQVSDSLSVVTDKSGKINIYINGTSLEIMDKKCLLKKINKYTRKSNKTNSNISYEFNLNLTNALLELSNHKNGAFITLESHLSLNKYIKSKNDLNVVLTKETLVHLFNPNNPYSNGAAIIRGNEIILSNVSYKLEQVPSFTDDSRFTSAKYISKKTDSITFLVSSETGEITLVLDGEFITLKSEDDILSVLNKSYKFVPKTDRPYGMLGKSEFTDSLIELSNKRRGALLTLIRKDNLSEFTSKAIPIDTKVRKDKLLNIFINYTPLHDGACIIKGNRIICAGAYFPLGDYKNIDRTTGSRHRAAIGISKVSDSLTFVVSEETGVISAAVNGNLNRFLKKDDIYLLLDKYI